jgi:hypothetical protein
MTGSIIHSLLSHRSKCNHFSENESLVGTGEQWGCRSSTSPSRVSLERRNRLFSKGNGSIIAHGWDKMEIPVKLASLLLLIRVFVLALSPLSAYGTEKPIFSQDLRSLGYLISKNGQMISDSSVVAFLSDELLLVAINQKEWMNAEPLNADSPLATLLLFDLAHHKVVQRTELAVAKAGRPAVIPIMNERFVVLNQSGLLPCSKDLKCGLVQPEMEKRRSPLVWIPPLRGGDFQGIGVYRPMGVSASLQRERLKSRAAKHRLDEPTGISLGMVASPQCPLPFRPADHCSSATTCRFSASGWPVIPPKPRPGHTRIVSVIAVNVSCGATQAYSSSSLSSGASAGLSNSIR